MRGTTTLVAATSLAVLAVAGCSAGADNGGQEQKGEAAKPAPPGPGTDPHATVNAYGGLVAEFISSRGETLGGKPVASEDDTRKGFAELACPELAESQIQSYLRFSKMRAKHPDPNDQYWAGIKDSRAEVKAVNVTGDKGTADLEMITVQGNSKGTVTLQKTGGRWEVCMPPGQQPGQQPGA